MAKAEALSRHYGVVRAPSKPSASITIPSESSGRPLFSLIGPLRWAYDFAGGSKPAYPPGPAFLRGAWQVASFSPVGVVRAVARRSVHRVDDCYGWPTGAHHNRAAFSRWEARGQHVPVSVSGLGILLSFSVHSFPIGWLLEYSVMLV